MQAHARRTVLTILKLAIGLGILVALAFQARDTFARLTVRSFNWWFLALALLCSLVTAGLSFWRWHILIRALDISISLAESLRLGALGFALNFVSPGSIGGDFFKAIFLAHGQPGKRPEAVASVIADRVAGLLTMLGLASIGILSTDLWHAESAWLRFTCRSLLIFSAVGWAGFLVAMSIGGRMILWLRTLCQRLPLTGRILSQLLGTVEVYRSRKREVAIAFAVSVVMALCFIATFYFVARGFSLEAPTWTEHMVIVPAAGLAGALPITPNGAGTTEFAVREMYKAMLDGSETAGDNGTIVAFGRRGTDIVVAVIGLVFYLRNRREVSEVMAEAEEAADAAE